jgi:polyvinyl alcohol dehydrogenase (cytochrome)
LSDRGIAFEIIGEKVMNWSGKLKYLSIFVLIATLVISTTVYAAAGNNQWLTAGHDISNTHYNSSESKIGVSNVSDLSPAWAFTTDGDVSAIAAADSTTVYVPDWAGNLYAINQKTGQKIWSHQISEYTGIAGDYIRATPAIVGNMLIFGDQGGAKFAGARLIAVNKKDGSPLWVTQVESYPAAIITQSAVVDTGGSFKFPVVYVGTASLDEVYAAFIPNYSLGFRGSIMAVNGNTGQILWKTYVVPDGYTGGAVWGSTPAIDHSRSSLFISTGNNYSMPDDVQTCVADAGDNTDAVKACISPNNHFDSILALDLKTGAIKWATAALPFDAWTVACLFGSPTCPQPAGPDYDFGQGPMLFTVNGAMVQPRDLVGAGQKSGQFWALDPDSGAVVWETQVGPGGTLGGLEWGSATDGNRIYVAETNTNHTPYTLLDGTTVTSGFWSALDAATGQVLWQTADPYPQGAIDTGPVTGANGVAYACSMDPNGHMYAMDGATGNILWDFASGGSCNSGAAISGGMVFWGSGYSNLGLGTPNDKFYAFQLP